MKPDPHCFLFCNNDCVLDFFEMNSALSMFDSGCHTHRYQQVKPPNILVNLKNVNTFVD